MSANGTSVDEEIGDRKRESPNGDESVPKKIRIDTESNQERTAIEVEDKNPTVSDVSKLFSHLDPIPDEIITPFSPLSKSELQELESVLEFSTRDSSSHNESGWKSDWSGNLGYFDKEIHNPLFRVKNGSIRKPRNVSSRGGKKIEKMSILHWAVEIEQNDTSKMKVVRRLVKNLLRQICTYDYLQNETNDNNSQSTQSPRHNTHQQVHKVPSSVVKLFSSISVESSPLSSIEETIRRASYDIQILKEDGWTTEKSNESQGASGGAMRIGENIRYEGADAVVIAYIHDNDLGDLWKAIWTEDYISFDLEAEELQRARHKWEKIYKKAEMQSAAMVAASFIRRKIGREAAMGIGALDFAVKGIEYGIVLASSYARGARHGVYWPARVMHASEAYGSVKRNSSKSQRKLDLMFLAPYWNASDDSVYSSSKVSVGKSLSESEESAFNANPLFQPESVDATDEMIKPYPCIEGNSSQLDISQLHMSFRFTGLPKSAFRRFVDSYRLASSLYEYAKSHLETVKPAPESAASHRATAALFEAHPLAVQVPLFPPVILHLPFTYILAQQPYPGVKVNSKEAVSGNPFEIEPVIQLASIINAMKPPHCWGQDENEDTIGSHNMNGNRKHSSHSGQTDSNASKGEWLPAVDDENVPAHLKLLSQFITEFPALSQVFDRFYSTPSLAGILSSLSRLLFLNIDENISSNKIRDQWLKSVVESWAVLKRMGEEGLSALSAEDLPPNSLVISQWRQAMERVYRVLVEKIRECTNIEGNGQNFSTLVVTDLMCNEHRTSDRCIERRVRLPAALQGAKLAGAKSDGPIRLMTSIPTHCLEYAEHKLVSRAHDSLYLKRMKNRCLAASTKEETLVLTDDSDGNGGEDTRGSEGSWKAALCGVAAAVAATDLVVRGESINAFCLTRPPGHHAGRSLHPMKAVSNGFCILNPVACAAIHATTSLVEGGLGLSRVCIIDFDVHHGNGTQDILCSTYDPRFLYVSLHAGGAWINGIAASSGDDPSDEPYGLAKNPKQTGIYPGRCGDTSPHKGVLNIPLGSKVMPHAVGTALLQRVTPAVKSFLPDLIILSAGFDAHKNDPMGLGVLSAEDFGNITEIACQLAIQLCSGRVVSVLEGGYGVPCCRPQRNTFLPIPTPLNVDGDGKPASDSIVINGQDDPQQNNNDVKVRPQPTKLLDLGENLPSDMDDQVPYPLQTRLEKCNAEGFMECVYEHVSALSRCVVRK